MVEEMSRHRCIACNGICGVWTSFNSKTLNRRKFWQCRDCKTEEDIQPRKKKVPVTADGIVAKLEAMGLGWSLDHCGNLIEARIWRWPNVIGRYRPTKVEPLAAMLLKALEQGGLELAPPLVKETK